MRRTVIGGQTAPDDYEVIWDDLVIGRIFRSIGVGGQGGWSWTAFLPNVPQRDQHRGGAGSLTEAKAASEPHGRICTSRSATTRSARPARSRAGAGRGTAEENRNVARRRPLLA
ncbi:hypothetical protein [Bradyrhizobium sp. 188]|uniref:hypothetical protein n=1 Tax=Bradyrhizobium sp. 188 TaxID=2782656 RepID=UPI001FF8D984|nr:hypothetical protein [Bradyrhizobium sp. 188]